MIRRDVLTQRDNRAVKLSLLAAVFALSLGAYAEHTLATQNGEATSTAAVQKPVPPAPPVVIAG